jgi:AraC-like DNA-binding protein
MARVTLDWIQVAALVGSVQGLLLVGALLAQRNNRTANRLLAGLMTAFTIYLAAGVYYASGLIKVYSHFFGVSFLMPWLFGPLVYLYAVAASDRSWRFRRRHLGHFVPVIVVAVVVSPYYLMSGAAKIAMFERIVAGEVPARIALLAPTKYLSGLGYSIATVAYLARHRRRIQDTYSSTERVNLRWLLWLAGAAAGVWVIATTLQVTDFNHRLREDHVSLGVALVVYAIGYMGLRQPEIFRYETSEFPVPRAAIRAPAESPASVDATAIRYERSGLADEEAIALEKSLVRLMEQEAPWRDSELTLPELATRLDSTPHKLSEVLNTRVGETFYDFVNKYRVRDVQRRLQAGEAKQRKMLALAMDAGFASKSTFNQAFKKHTAQTPSGFRQAVGG